MLTRRYSGQTEVQVRVQPQYGVLNPYRSKRQPFMAKIVYSDYSAIAVLIDQWWIFFDTLGRQYGEFPEIADFPEFELYE